MKEGAKETMSGPSGTMAASMKALALMTCLTGQIWKRDLYKKIPKPTDARGRKENDHICF
jgi:hypothetical protein